MNLTWVTEAIELIRKGLTNKIESPDKNIVVYRVKNVIRIDIKNVLSED